MFIATGPRRVWGNEGVCCRPAEDQDGRYLVLSNRGPADLELGDGYTLASPHGATGGGSATNEARATSPRGDIQYYVPPIGL